jgi:hypothetical protein
MNADNTAGAAIAKTTAQTMADKLQGYESCLFDGLWPFAAEALDPYFPELDREQLQALAKITASGIIQSLPDTFVLCGLGRYRYGQALPE